MDDLLADIVSEKGGLPLRDRLDVVRAGAAQRCTESRRQLSRTRPSLRVRVVTGVAALLAAAIIALSGSGTVTAPGRSSSAAQEAARLAAAQQAAARNTATARVHAQMAALAGRSAQAEQVLAQEAALQEFAAQHAAEAAQQAAARNAVVAAIEAQAAALQAAMQQGVTGPRAGGQ